MPTSTNGDPFASLLPEAADGYPRGRFNSSPTFTPAKGMIERGYTVLAERIVGMVPQGLRVLAIDGYHGVNWMNFRHALNVALQERNVEAEWLDMRDCLAEPAVIDERIAPFLGGDDPIFGTHFPLGIDASFEAKKLADFRTRAAVARGRAAGSLTIFYGCGAGLLELYDELWYADLPKDVIQQRSREGEITNFGHERPESPSDFYKRAYFVDWPALNRLKRRLLPQLDVFLDLQDDAHPTAMEGEAFRSALRELAETPFRPRPWFSPGAWGGQYMKGHMGLSAKAPNYAWSFELITPENGIVLEKNGAALECSFDCLMFQEHERVLGEAARQFKYEWPLRFDYLDTVDGGNLSVQCHPRPDYMREEFGETFTQDETYYITAAKPGARVYLGLQEACDAEEFRQAVTYSAEEGGAIDYEKYIHSVPSNPHDLFVIPNGTVHCSGEGNLVLEISATPYIFTFKIYDYVRRDLDGNMRPINIERAWDNIRFERKKDWVREHLVMQPRLLRKGDGWKEFVLSERKESFFNIHRMEFEKRFSYETQGRALAVNLVEGETIEVTAANGRRTQLNYLESMVIPAATGRFEVINKGERPGKLVIAYVRPGVGVNEPLNDPID